MCACLSMAKEPSRRCVLLGVCALLCVVCVCVHVYVELTWRVGDRHPRVSAASPVHKPVIPATLRRVAKDAVGPRLHRMVQCNSVWESERWSVCEDERFSLTQRIASKHCRVYSLGLGADERYMERALVKRGCEAHCFDPSIPEPHLQDGERLWVHRLSVDWRDPNPAISAQRYHGNTKKLATILNNFGHQEVDILKVDMESAEWKILENLILEGVLSSVGQLLLEVHLHWAGFEVSGEEHDVVRYWFSLLKEVELAHFSLFHSWSDPDRPRLFLHKNLWNASSVYRLGWVNTRWK
ncbi:probable methyltransferase-like protein 24 isoform X2 [Engraulis encrasicolus]|uniref:probable methyltransferase-like protein 24 isoform X2 n=1 Tax=Engraulis encrasicolus TaxID=184585 RepID=UPI002FD1D296